MNEIENFSFKKMIGKVLKGLFIGFIPFIIIGGAAIGVRYIFNNLTIGIITFFGLSILFVVISWILEKRKK